MRIVKMCSACPEQYDIFLDNGWYAYFRYRYGRWSLELYADESLFGRSVLASCGEDYREERGYYDGMLEEGEAHSLIARHLPLLIQIAERNAS